MKYYFEDGAMIFKIKGKLHKKILLYNINYRNHIKIKHPEMTIRKIVRVLEEPDFIYKSSKRSKTFYYEKLMEDCTYRVVITSCKKHVKSVITAYRVIEERAFTCKHVHCAYYKKKNSDLSDKLEDDKDYFYKLFNVEQ